MRKRMLSKLLSEEHRVNPLHNAERHVEKSSRHAMKISQCANSPRSDALGSAFARGAFLELSPEIHILYP